MTQHSPNNHLMIVCGPPATGKSMTFRNLRNPEGVFYINCESGKKLPFRYKFTEHVLEDPYDVPAIFDQLAEEGGYHTVIIDGFNFMMNLFESRYITNSADSRKGWSLYADFIRNLFFEKIAQANLNVIITAHLEEEYNEETLSRRLRIPVKGSMKAVGIESMVSLILCSKRVKTKDLEKYQSNLLNIDEDEQEDGFKYVLQTRLTKDNVNEPIRHPLKFWNRQETFIDNDVQLVLDRLDEYYGD